MHNCSTKEVSTQPITSPYSSLETLKHTHGQAISHCLSYFPSHGLSQFLKETSEKNPSFVLQIAVHDELYAHTHSYIWAWRPSNTPLESNWAPPQLHWHSHLLKFEWGRENYREEQERKSLGRRRPPLKLGSLSLEIQSKQVLNQSKTPKPT